MTTSRDIGLLALRLGIGGTLIGHGTQKLFGWFGGAGLDKTAAGFENIGFRPGKLNAVAAGLGEAGGGALLVAGLAIPGAGAAIAGTMVVASSMHASNGFFSQNGGYEFPAVLGVGAAGLVLTGPGSFSLDHALDHRLNRGWMRLIALAAVPPLAYAVISRRRRALAVPAESPAAETAAESAPAGTGAVGTAP
jgi:putative oxidoreductase